MKNIIKSGIFNLFTQSLLGSLPFLMVLASTGCLRLIEKIPVLQGEPSISETMPTGKSDNSSQSGKLFDLAFALYSPAQKLDLYVPEGHGPFPLVIIIHGGDFKEGKIVHSAEIDRADPLLDAGNAITSINYRLSGKEIYLVQI
jgi:acetyl esterase/lipase